ncbi:MAG: phosphoglycerate kinase, partial [Patescibacteria group bacterium]
YLLKKKATVILVTHIGRPGGKKVAALSVAPVAKKLKELLELKELKILTLETYIKNRSPKSEVRSPHVMLLENIRFYKGEEENDPAFAKQLASLADIFVLDGFAVAHRDAASVSGVAKYLPAYAGLLLEKEIVGLDRVMKRPKKPLTLVLGGAKTETKIPVMKHLLPKAEYVLIGGRILNTYLAAKGYRIGNAGVDEKYTKEVLRLCSSKKVIKPVDVVVGDTEGKNVRVLDVKKLEIRNLKLGIYDIGPATVRMYAAYIKKSQTLVWNGAMGYFEQPPYHHATLAIARLVASRSKGKAFGVIGGGETLQTMEMTGMSEYVDLISTGGGAMLEYLAGAKLPGIAALRKAKKSR